MLIIKLLLTDFLSITCSGTEEKVEGNYEQTSPRSSNDWHFVKITARPGLDKVLAVENIFISFHFQFSSKPHFPYSYDCLPLQTRCSSGRTRQGWSGSWLSPKWRRTVTCWCSRWVNTLNRKHTLEFLDFGMNG